MGSGGSRYGAGRPGWRRKCEYSLPFDIRKLDAKGYIGRIGHFGWHWTRDNDEVGSVGVSTWPDSVTLSYSVQGQAVTCRINVVRTPCHYGGSRPWFICPDCDRRCAVVYAGSRHGGFACRFCLRLAYVTEAIDPISRCWRAQSKLEAKLTEDGLPPKGMRLRTFERIQDRLDKLEDRKDAYFLPGFYRLAQRFGMSPEDLFK